MFISILNFLTDTIWGGIIILAIGLYIFIISLRDTKSEQYVMGNIKGLFGGASAVVLGLIIIIFNTIELFK